MGLTDYFSELYDSVTSSFVTEAHAEEPQEDSSEDAGDSEEGSEDTKEDGEEGGEEGGDEEGGDEEEEEEEDDEPVDPKPQLEEGKLSKEAFMTYLGVIEEVCTDANSRQNAQGHTNAVASSTTLMNAWSA